MSKKLLLILLVELLLSTPVLVTAQTVENKRSLAIFSQLKDLRSRFPAKSKFETDEEYQQKIEATSILANPLYLEFSPYSGEYNPETQQLEIKLGTSYSDVSSVNQVDKAIAKKGVIDDSYKYLLNYRTDSQVLNEEVVTCVNGFGARYQYAHITSKSNNYMINTVGIDIDDKISLKMLPQQVRKYFKQDESSLNDRLKIKLVLHPVTPFYSNYTTYHGGDCPDSALAKSFADLFGETSTTMKNNHLIHADVGNLEVIDSITGEKIYNASFPKQIDKVEFPLEY